MATRAEVRAAAAAIANARAGRRGVPAVTNILELLEDLAGGKLYRDVLEDAEAALKAAEAFRHQISESQGGST